MPLRSRLYTSESVSVGHPDKMADQISDAILDAMLTVDPDARVACETLLKSGVVVVAGEVTCRGYVDITDIVRRTVLEIGYDDGELGFDGHSCAVLITLDQQSKDIARGVDTGGAGDQGMMFGFACKDTPSFMPLPIDLAHRLVARQAEARRGSLIPHLRPDAKAQVTVEYNGLTPVRLHTVVLSTQHGPEWNDDQTGLKDAVIEQILRPVLGDWWNDQIVIHVNPTGRFEIGGPQGDCGLTGRKIIVDSYGGRGRHGGGCFSGKDPSKVDRSAAYMARYIAKNIVAADLADVCEVQPSYAIGKAQPISVNIDCEGTARIDEAKLAQLVREHFDLTPQGIIKSLDLRRPIYRVTACHGHFGRPPGTPGDGGGDNTFTWEKTDQADALRAAAQQYAGTPA